MTISNTVLAAVLAKFSDEFKPAQLQNLVANAKEQGYFTEDATPAQVAEAVKEYYFDSGDDGIAPSA